MNVLRLKMPKTSEEIWNRFQRILFDIQTSKGEDKRKYLSELGEFNHKEWLPADKSVLIEDVKKIAEQLKPKPNHQTNAQGCSMLFDELILKLNSLKGK